MRDSGIRSELIYCATLTLPSYSGIRYGVIHVDGYRIEGEKRRTIYNNYRAKCNSPEPMFLTNNTGRTEVSTLFQYGVRLLELLMTAELVVTNRLHVLLPCLAFKTPVLLSTNIDDRICQATRFSLIDSLGIDVSGVIEDFDNTRVARNYISFLEENLNVTHESMYSFS